MEGIRRAIVPGLVLISGTVIEPALSVGPQIVVVICLLRPMEGMGRLQFSDLFTEVPVPP